METKPPAPFTPKEVRLTLPVSGKVAVISARELTGYDREQADIIRNQKGGSQFAWFHAMVSRVTSIEEPGKDSAPPTARQCMPDDLSAMSTRDIDALTDALKGDLRFFPKGAESPTPTFPPTAH